MPPHRRMRSYFLKLAHTFSTPLLSSLSTKSRAQDPQTRSRFLVHDFGLKRKSTTNFFPLPRLSLSTTSSSTFFLFLSSFSLRPTKRSMRSSAAWKFKFPRRGGWSQSDLLPGYFMLEGNRFRSSVFTYIKLVVGIPARDGWKKFSLSGTGQTKLVILCKRCCVSGGKRLQIETASVFALCGSWILLPPCSYLFPSDFRTNVCGLWNFGVKGFEHRRKSSFSEDTHTQVVIIRNDSNNSNSNPPFPKILETLFFLFFFIPLRDLYTLSRTL